MGAPENPNLDNPASNVRVDSYYISNMNFSYFLPILYDIDSRGNSYRERRGKNAAG
jgi:hypothetical protein